MQGAAFEAAPPLLAEILQACGVHGVLRGEAENLWTETERRLSYCPVSISAAMIDYMLTYWSADPGRICDLSLVLHHDSRPCGLWSLSMYQGPDGFRLGSSGGSMEPPLFVKGLAEKSLNQLNARCLEVALRLADAYEIASWQTVESFSGSTGLSVWHERAMRAGASLRTQHDLYVDLSPEFADIKRTIRKSYKSLISTGEREWQVAVLDGPGEDVWDTYRLLHLEVAGRATRSLESWQVQYQAIQAGTAFLVYLRDQGGRMVGGGLFHFTHDEGVYAVGAYDRNLFAKPLGHVVQFRAIEELKRRGVRWYKIGARPYPSDNPVPTAKELAIADFKQGFSSHLFPRYFLDFNQKAALSGG